MRDEEVDSGFDSIRKSAVLRCPPNPATPSRILAFVKTGEGGMMPTLFCLSRCKYVPDTPEERVRQQMLMKLRDELGGPIPSDYVAVELHLSYAADTNDRADIVLYKPDGDKVVPWMVIEIKAPNQPLDDDVHAQAWRYCQHLGVPRYALYNGTEEPHVVEVPSMDNPDVYHYMERISRFNEVLAGIDVSRADAEAPRGGLEPANAGRIGRPKEA